MKTLLISLLLVICTQVALAQKDTIVYYKKHVPQASSQDADYQVIVRQKNKKTSILQKAKFKDGKWKVNQTETIKLKSDNTYSIKNGKYNYQRKYEKIKGGYLIEEYNHKGELISKGISRSLFPLHRDGQWQIFYQNKLVGIRTFKEEVTTSSNHIGKNKERFPTNSFTNADSLASYKENIKSFQIDLARNLKYPEICQNNKIEKRILVLFAILTDGTPSEFQILSDSNQYFNQAAITAIKDCDKWKPALKNNKPVKVYNIVPINFQLK